MSRRNNYLDRELVLTEAYERCLAEMYEKAQPSFDFKGALEKARSKGEIIDTKDDPIYKRHYLSHDEAKYIVDKYHKAYRLDEEFSDDCDILLRDIKKGYPVDKYIEEHTDENGNHHPGHRGYEDRPPMNEQVKQLLDNIKGSSNEKLSDEIVKLFTSFIENRKDFYRFGRDAEKFDTSVWLGPCPWGNKDDVIEYWKSKGKDITIEEHNPEYLWERDNGWTDEDIRDEYELSEDDPL